MAGFMFALWLIAMAVTALLCGGVVLGTVLESVRSLFR